MKQNKGSAHIPHAVIDARDALCEIIETDFPLEAAYSQEEQLSPQNNTIRQITSPWRKEEDDDTESAVQEIFRIILRYLQSIHRKKQNMPIDTKTKETIRDLMVLIGEAARKLDRFTSLFHETKAQCATGTREYRALRNFYWKHINQPLSAEALSQRILHLTQQQLLQKQPHKTNQETQHQIVDLESGKKDEHYELFFLQRENGSRFYSPSLLRNMQLVNDFGDRIDPTTRSELLQTRLRWIDLIHHEAAKNILSRTRHVLSDFFEQTHHFAKQETVAQLNQAIISLMMASHPENLLENTPAKSCREYFVDFHSFLRKTISSDSYLKWKTHPPQDRHHFAHTILHTVHSICHCFFTQLHGTKRLEAQLEEWITHLQKERSQEHEKSAEQENAYWNILAAEGAALDHFFLKYPNGPLNTILSLFQDNRLQRWDPLMAGHLPNVLFDLYLEEKRIIHPHFPTPVTQEKINEASPTPEWIGFLDSLKESTGETHLFFNLQDRTSWYGHARTVAIEETTQQTTSSPMTVITLAMDTDFYHQKAPFDHDNRAEQFFKQFLEQLKAEQTGFSFPESFQNELHNHFAPNILPLIHQVFFEEKNVLTPEHRRQFIDLFYVFLILKCIDWFQPTSFGLTCKDGVDIGPCYTALLYGMLKNIEQHKSTSDDLATLRRILFLPAFLYRERAPRTKCFERMIGSLRTLEHAREEIGYEAFRMLMQESFQVFFDQPVLQMKVR